MILDEIIEHKALELAESKRQHPVGLLIEKIKDVQSPRNFFDKIRSRDDDIRIIAEIKKSSPSKGLLTENFDPAELARKFQDYGASAISVLTDYKYFGGSLEDLSIVRDTVQLPLLRKDFIIDPYQVYEARCYGADAVLLIVAALEITLLKELKYLIESLGMYPLVEVHDEIELEIALDLESPIIGINNRDLKTFNVDLTTAVNLSDLIPPDRLIISESGISSPEDILFLYKHGIRTFLVGEILVKSGNISDVLACFLNINK